MFIVTDWYATRSKFGPRSVSERLAKQQSTKYFRFIWINWTAPKWKIFAQLIE